MTQILIRPPSIRVALDRGDLVVDGFAGGGGASVGIESAIGRSADIAINHDAVAIAVHKANHPNAKHYQTDIWDVDPTEACGGRDVALAWFSPDCKHFSKAKGGKPKDDNIRGLAWVMTLWAERVRPRVMMLENVEEFVTWGPLGKDGRPVARQQGCTFHKWRRRLIQLGYKVEFKLMSACDYGAPTTRKRLFLIARCDDQPIRWPVPTHGEDLVPYRTAGEIIDWSLPMDSIFKPGRNLVPNTMKRIADGLRRYVVEAQEPFIVRTGHHTSGGETTFRGQPMTRPLATVCATNDKNLVVPSLRPVGSKGRGSTAPLLAAFITKHYTGVVGHTLRRPIGTITSKDHHSLTCAFLTKYYGTGVARPMTDPLGTITTRDRFGLVTVELGGDRYEITDIGMRMLKPRELFNGQGFPSDYKLDAAPTQKHKIRLAGNSVCPPMSQVLVQENM